MNQKEPFLRRILPYLLNENSHMGLFGPLYLLWHCEYQTCLRWYGLPAALLVLAHGAFGWGIGHKLLPLVELGCYSMLACVLWMYVVNIRFSLLWHKLPHTDGFDGLYVLQYVKPGITTIDQNVREKGYSGVKTLYEMMQGKAGPQNIYVPYKLTKRDSVTKI